MIDIGVNYIINTEQKKISKGNRNKSEQKKERFKSFSGEEKDYIIYITVAYKFSLFIIRFKLKNVIILC